MFRPSSRDFALVSGLLPLFTREITADPEQHNRARREARIRSYKEIGRFMNETRFEAERRQDDELRAKLDCESGPLGCWIMTDHLRRESRRPITASPEWCRAVSITDCRQAKAYHETFCLSNFVGGCQRDRTHAAPCDHLQSRSVNRTVQLDDEADDNGKG